MLLRQQTKTGGIFPMKMIMTEEMRFRQRVVKYAIKHNNNAKATRGCHTSHQQVQR